MSASNSPATVPPRLVTDESLTLATVDRTLAMPSISVPGSVPYSNGYELSKADEAAALSWAKQQPSIDPSLALEAIGNVVGPAQRANIERLITIGAEHPTVVTTFPNFLASNTALAEIPDTRKATLREAKKQYMYIESEQVGHHPHIGRHTLDVGALTIALARIAGISSDELPSLASKGALHDSYKIADMLLQRIGELKADPLSFGLPHGEEIRHILSRAGVSNGDIDQMLEGGKWVAHSSIHLFLEPVQNQPGVVQLNDRLIAEICLHVADDMMRETTPLPVRYRMLATGFSEPLDKIPGNYKYPDLWNRGLYLAPNGEFLDRGLSADNSGLHLVGRFIDLQLAAANAMASMIIECGLRAQTITEADVCGARTRIAEARPPLTVGVPNEPQPDEILYILAKDRLKDLFQV